MKKYLFITVLLLLVFSCTEKKEKIPDNVLPMDKMVSVMIDVHLIEANISSKNLPKDTGKIYFFRYRKDMLKKHKIDDSLYIRSYEFYTSHPDLIDKIYENVIDSLSLREGQQK